MDPHAGRIVLNGAVSQYARALEAAQARRVKVDGRSQAALLAFAEQFGRLIWFYGPDDQPDGDWSAFFVSDPAALAASMRRSGPRRDEAALAARAQALLAAGGAAEKGVLLAELFAAPLALAHRVDAWLRALPELPASPAAERLHARLEAAVREQMAPGLRRLRGWDAGAAAREALGRPVGMDYSGLLPLWEVEGARPDASLWRGATLEARMDHAAPRLVEAFAELVDAVGGAARGAAELEASAADGEQKPQLALYAAFVALYRTAQRTLNSLTPRYARFYYHRVLREGLRGPVPDQVYLAFALDPTAAPRAIVGTGTLFPAGTDADGQAVLYAADRGVVVTPATLAGVRMLRAVPGPLVTGFRPAWSPPVESSPPDDGDGETVPVQRVLASAVPAAAAGGADAGAAGWPTFGSAQAGTVGAQATAPATLGFAVASPQLLLSGGQRWLAVTVRYAAGDALERRVAAVSALTDASAGEVLRQVVEGALELDLSTPAGWLRLSGYRADVTPGTGGGRFTLRVELPATAPAVTPLYAGGTPPAEADPAAEPVPNPAPGLPTLAARLRDGVAEVTGPLGTAEVPPLPFLETMTVQGVEVHCWVRGVGDVVLANTDGDIGPGGPFPVFGATPAVGAWLELRSVELFTKVPHVLAVTVSWLALPPNDTGFEGWYRDYRIGMDGLPADGLFDNAVFRGRLRVVGPSRWTLQAPGSPDPLPYEPVYLFRTRDRCLEPRPEPAAPLCADTRFERLRATAAPAVPPFYDPAAPALRLELDDPPYAFGNDLYAPNVLDAVMRELPNATACQARCAAACAPLDQAAAALGACLAACAGSPPDGVCVDCLVRVRDALAAAAAQCWTACAGVSPPGACVQCGVMSEGVDRLDACIALAQGGAAPDACVEACRAWLAEAYGTAQAACIEACMRPGVVRYPNAPWLPQAQQVSVDYGSRCRIDPAAGAGECGALFHLEPFGGWTAMTGEDGDPPPLLPRAGAPGSLLLGFDALEGGDTLTLLFQLAAPGGAAPPATPPEVAWSRLEGDRWAALDAEQVPADTTHGLRNSGIVALRLPRWGAPTGTRIPGGQRWLRCAALGEPEGFPWTVSLLPHATTATWVDPGEPSAAHFAAPLPAGTITGTVQDVAGLGAVLQPMPSFGGRAAETERSYGVRLAERLRHKDRAAQSWDYERLVLERFPQLWKASALPARGAGGRAPGSVLVVVVASAEGNESADTTVPRAPTALLGAVQDFLAARASPFASIQVVNPVYVRVQVRAEVAFRAPGAGGDAGGDLDRLNADLVAWLSPWFAGPERATHEGTYAYEGDISAFIQSRPYVDALLSLELSHDPEPETLEWYFLTSATQHDLRERAPSGGFP